MFELIKSITSMMAGIGALNLSEKFIEAAYATATKGKKITTATQVCNKVGAVAIGAIVADAASDKVETYFDKAKAMFNGAVNAAKEVDKKKIETTEVEDVKEDDANESESNTVEQ